MNIDFTSQKAIDGALKVLQASKDTWVALGIDERIAILEEVNRDMLSVAERWIIAYIHEKGISVNSSGEGEEWGVLAAVFLRCDCCASN